MSTEQKIATVMIPDERVCIVPVGYDVGVDGDPGCPIVEDANLPNPIVANARYVLANPFGINVPVNAVSELFVNGIWGPSYTSHYSYSYGNMASFAYGVGVVLQTASTVWAISGTGCGPHGVSGNNPVSAPCRVYVTRGKQ